MLSAGGNGAAGTTGASGNGGGGGGGGGYGKLTYSSGTVGSTVAFLVGTGGAGSNTQTAWDYVPATGFYFTGETGNASGVTGGGGGAGGVSAGTPAITYTVTTSTAGGAGSSLLVMRHLPSGLR